MTGGALYSGGLVLQYFWFLLQAISSCIYNTVGSWQQEPKLTGLLSPWTGSLFPFGNLEGPAPQAFCLPILFSSSTRTAAMKSDFAGACFGLNAHPAEVGPCCTMLPLYVTYKEAKRRKAFRKHAAISSNKQDPNVARQVVRSISMFQRRLRRNHHNILMSVDYLVVGKRMIQGGAGISTLPCLRPSHPSHWISGMQMAQEFRTSCSVASGG